MVKKELMFKLGFMHKTSGDRGNILIDDGFGKNNTGVFLYTHWGGGTLPIDVKRVLEKRRNWDDGPALTKMLFDEVTGLSKTDTNHFGISTAILDNDNTIIYIDCKSKTVGFSKEGTNLRKPFKKWTFDEFIQTDLNELLKHYGYLE